ncbi:FAD-dependent oxidoreductase [Verrucomicrobiota bacterium]
MSKHVIVLGAGACGLAAAWELVERGHRVTVIERAPLVGGLAGCVEHEHLLCDKDNSTAALSRLNYLYSVRGQSQTAQ